MQVKPEAVSLTDQSWGHEGDQQPKTRKSEGSPLIEAIHIYPTEGGMTALGG